MTRGALRAPSMLIVLNSDGFQRALGQGRRNGQFLNFQLNSVGHFDDHEVVRNLNDLARDTAGGDHFVALLQATQQVLLLFGALGLGTPDHQVENNQEADQKHPFKTGTGRGASSWGSISSKSSRNQKAHVTLLYRDV